MISKEEEFIDSVVRRYAAFGRAGDVFGIGDDCAVLPGPGGLKYLVTCDLLTEDTHFARELTGPRELGIKAAAVNISDIAGMAGRPLWAFVSIGVPEVDKGWLDEFYGGMHECLSENGTLICGGDTVKSDKTVINITVVGQSPAPVMRSGAREGDALMVCGTPGESAAGLKALLAMGLDAARDKYPRLTEKHLTPRPVMSAYLLRGCAHSMMDLSDGLFKDLPTMCAASGKGAYICEEALPAGPELQRFCRDFGEDPADMAVKGGEDYGLLFACSGDAAEKCIDIMKDNGVSCFRLGTFTEETEIYIRDKAGRKKPLPSGWQHFGKQQWK